MFTEVANFLVFDQINDNSFYDVNDDSILKLFTAKQLIKVLN